MDHKPKLRPALPGATPTPTFIRNNSESNVYASITAAHQNKNSNYNDDMLPLPESSGNSKKDSNNINSVKSSQLKAIQKMVAKFPFEIRENVSAVINMTLSSTENLQHELDFHNKEVYYLRQELSKKNQDTLTLNKTLNIYQERVRILEEDIRNLKDNVDSRQKYMTKNRGAMSKLAATNRMLIDSLNALDSTGGKLQPLREGGGMETNPGTPIAITNSNNISNTSAQNSSRTGRKLSPIRRAVSPMSASTNATNLEFFNDNERPLSPPKSNNGTIPSTSNNIQHGPSQYQRDKLRESLLKVSREHYRSLKNSEVLEAKVNELRSLLRTAEQQNRKLKSELDEISSLKIREDRGKNADEQKAAHNLTGSDSPRVLNNSSSIKVIKFGYIDDRFSALIGRNAIDPIDGIMHMRRILAHIATAPNNLNFNDMVAHIVSKDSMKIFDSDIICLYIVSTGNGDSSTLLKYTLRSREPVIFTAHSMSAKSIAMETISTGKVSRLNSMYNQPNFNADIDGSPGVITRRILALPLFNTDTNELFGAIQIINKSQGRNNDGFSEVDELFGLVYADQASLLLSSCYVFDRVNQRSHLLESLLESSTALFAAVPEPNSLASAKAFQPGDLLSTMENICKTVLRCPNARGFLLSDYIPGMDPGHLVFLQNNNMHSISKYVKQHLTTTAPIHSGIAGHVVRSKIMYVLEDNGFDPYLNPLVDVDPILNAMVAVPISDLYGNVVGCLEFVCGPNSPKMRVSLDPSDKKNILFPQAAEWLTHQIATPLQYLMGYIGKPAYRPVSTPTSISIPTGFSAVSFMSDVPTISNSHSSSQERGESSLRRKSSHHHHHRHHHHHSHKAGDGGSTRSSDFQAIPLEGIKSEDGDFDSGHPRVQPVVAAGGSGGKTDYVTGSDVVDLRSKIDEDKGKLALYAGTVTLLEKEIETLQEQVMDLRSREDKYKSAMESQESSIKQSSTTVTDLQKEIANLLTNVEKSTTAYHELYQRYRQLESSKEQEQQDAKTKHNELVLQNEKSMQQKQEEVDSLTATLKAMKDEKKSEQLTSAGQMNQFHEKLARTAELLQVKEDEVTELAQNLAESEKLSAAHKKQCDELKRQNEHLQKQIQILQEEKVEKDDNQRSAAAQRSSLEVQVRKLNEEIEKSKAEYFVEKKSAAEKFESYRLQIHELLEDNARLTLTLDETEEKNQALQAELSRAIAAASTKGDNDNDSVNELNESSMSVGDSLSKTDAIEELQMRYKELQEVKDSEYASYVKQMEQQEEVIHRLQEEIRSTRQDVQKDNVDKEKSKKTIDTLSAEVAKLKATIAEKDSVQAILQEQLLKMANEKINKVNEEISASNSQAPNVEDDGSEVRVGDWLMQFDSNGNEFWVNQITGVSAWEIPTEEDESMGSIGESQYNIEL